MSKELDYVGLAACGCVRYAICSSAPKQDLKKALGEILNYGLNLQRMSTEDIRKASWGCPICEPPKVRKTAPALPRQEEMTFDANNPSPHSGQHRPADLPDTTAARPDSAGERAEDSPLPGDPAHKLPPTDRTGV